MSRSIFFRGIRPWAALSVLGLVQLMSVVPASAKSSSHAPSRKSREDAAKMACSVGDVAKGIEILAGLYVETNDPVYVHNQGRCYQQNGQPEKAIARFEEFLRKASGLPPEERAAVDGHIKECQSKLEKASGPAAPQPPSTADAVQAQAAPIPRAAQVGMAEPVQHAVTVAPSVAPTPNRGGGLRAGGIAMAAVGLVGIGAGVTFNVLERNLHNRMAGDPKENTSSNESTRGTYQTISVIGYAGGGALLAAGVVLYVLGVRQGNETEHTIALVPELTTNEIGLTFKGLF